ncbi:WG repeat-containing protein [Bacteroides reticulotermitis]|uniref:WG repeat-containing protein n=1 Tax=Bacteroides reticulotermitis TaxID=1133319 RepID=UPI003A872AED
MDIDSRTEIIPAINDDIRCYCDELWCVLRDKVWYLWQNGSIFEIGEYDSANFINEEFIRLERSLNTVFGDILEKIIYSIREKTIESEIEAHIFYEDLAIVRIDGKYGFVNHFLKSVISAIYNHIENFENGFAYAEIGKENYYINTRGQQVISGVFKYKEPEDNNYDNHDDFEGIYMYGRNLGWLDLLYGKMDLLD